MNKRHRSPVRFETLRSHPTSFLAFGFGTGLAPVAPGTVGTLAAVPVFILLSVLPLIGYLTATAGLFWAGVKICGDCEERLGGRDHPGIVWDEMVGFLVAMAGSSPSWQSITLGFLLFRAFDVLKPWPIAYVDRRIQGGLGIMLDDAIAGILAWAVLHALRYALG